LTSPYARPDRTALDELERLLAATEEELLAWRTRCLKAEQEVPHGRGKGALGAGPDREQARQRIGILEGENLVLRQRIAAAKEQVERLRTRLRFVEDHGAGDAA
jgi:hypothetical protein